MAPTLFDQKPEPGDLIEIFRGTYQHWAVYIGDGFIIHLAPPTESAQAGAYSMMSVLCDKAKVKKEELWEVVGTDQYRINNLLDDKYRPRSPSAIVKEAKSWVGQELPYCVFRGNCEHFATELRYGKAESRQVRHAVEVGVGVGVAAMIGVGVLAAAAAIFGGGSKEKKNNQ
ncbi:phospholipase A and acyltransferase 3-like [Anguilla anguilla]|uniref:phospholipase A and acyltransferase 3-like n=1 Tax=Anguilla anguilla TaxID=7936 RepID=UPI0015AEB393|nr:phospholipase A and acyltransferase 3-like [Anguilla anguilla]XP_035265389.1 phospholipase A and acyltransferase 3-like [Anguilla anguilla]